MARLLDFQVDDKAQDFVVIDTTEMDQAELEAEYDAELINEVEIDDNVTSFPTDRALTWS